MLQIDISVNLMSSRVRARVPNTPTYKTLNFIYPMFMRSSVSYAAAWMRVRFANNMRARARGQPPARHRRTIRQSNYNYNSLFFFFGLIFSGSIHGE